jgi:class 3 adenylate cyclase/tetratricopeptide (TPR) repeat protein
MLDAGSRGLRECERADDRFYTSVVERKLATVLFIDIVGSTQLVVGADPEVARRRVNRFFDTVSRCVEQHGGIVEKFAGDAVLAAFGVPHAHEDHVHRAARSALAMRAAVEELELEARIGVEAGELVVDGSDSSFATGEAVNLAARLQQAARPGEILLGPTAYRLASGSVVVEDAGPLELKGLGGPQRGWRLIDALETPLRRAGPRSPLVGREPELDLLRTTFARTERDRRAHLFTIFGEPGIGKSRLAREFADGLERASVLTGRCLPYGEGITYWPLAEMIKAAAGIADDDPLEEAFEKLRACCAEEALADVLGLASGLLDALDSEHGAQDIGWAVRELMSRLADVQPLVLVFEDIHWAEAPLLDLIEHVSDGVREPLLIVCLARPELLDVRPDWGGGRVRSTAIELEPLSESESGQLVGNLVAQLTGSVGERPPVLPEAVLERAEGNPLFVEETIRMLVEGGDRDDDRIPDTLQALIAARIDNLGSEEKTLLQRAAVTGRVFWRGALGYLSPDVPDLDAHLTDLLHREFLLREPRSSLSGETAYRFKHLLIREVAYAGMAKMSRAQYHARFADWLSENAGEELVEIRAYHLDQAVQLLTELDGAPPSELAATAAGALVKAAKRALGRESWPAARRLALRAVELEPSLTSRYVAARAAWRLQDWGAVKVEMEKVLALADEREDRETKGLALTALADATLRRDADPERARELVDEALALLETFAAPVAHFDALTVRAVIATWTGDGVGMIRYFEKAYAVALDAGRKDLQTMAAQALAQIHLVRFELDEAELLLTRALELAGESGSMRGRAGAALAYAWFLMIKGELDAAETLLEEVRTTSEELAVEPVEAAALAKLAWIARRRGDGKRAEKLFREALRIVASRGDRGALPDYQAGLAAVLADVGKLDEAEPLAIEARENVGPQDIAAQVEATQALAVVRWAQGRRDEAEELLAEAIAVSRGSDFPILELEPLENLVRLLRESGRESEAAACEARLAELTPATATPVRSA